MTTPFKYLYLDGTNFKMRIGKQVELVNVLVVIGVGEEWLSSAKVTLRKLCKSERRAA
jgi:hypothetical protein